jgi:TonB-dependent receptor
MKKLALSIAVMSAINVMAANVMAQDVSGIEEIIVVGTKVTLISAIEKQRESNNLISVVDSDALGSFADTTAAEAIRRLPGISIENDQSEGRYVTIRGLSSDLNSIAVNGASMVAPENGRSVMLDGLPTELLDSITVAKSLTPEMDADSIGGRVDFKTKNPSELTKRLLTLKVQNNFSEYADEQINPKLALTYGDQVTDTVAHVVGLTYSSKDIVAFNNETGFGWNNGVMNDDYEMRYYELTRERYGFTYDVDFAVGDDRLFVNLFWNQYDDSELRWKDEYGDLGDQVLSTSDSGMVVNEVKHDAETRVREETRTIAAFNLGYETELSEWAIDSMVSYSFAEEDDSNNAEANFRTKYRNGDKVTTINWSNPQRPYLTPADASLYDPAEMDFDGFEVTSNISQDSELAFVFNAEKEFDFGVLKTGVKVKSREKDVDDYIIVYDGWGDKTLAEMNPQTNTDWHFANQTFSQQADPNKVWEMKNLVSEMDVDFEDATSRDFTTTEDIFAAYVQNTYSWDKGLVIAGVRYENTSTDSQAVEYGSTTKTNASSDHSFFAPSVNVKYFFNDQLQFRAAIWKGLSRPGFLKTAPKIDVSLDTDGSVSGSAGNPNLKPYEAINYDLSIEFYGEGMTFISAGLFRKDIKNAIYPTLQTNATYMGVSFNDGVESWINAGDSTINGLELNAQYGWDNGFYVAANATLTDGESSFTFEDDKTFTTPFRKLADEAANISLGYEKDRWDVRLAANYRSEYLDWLADEDGSISDLSENNMRWVESYLQVDLTAKYQVSPAMQIKLEAINLGNRPEYYYWGDDSQLSQYDTFGRNYSLSMNYNF